MLINGTKTEKPNAMYTFLRRNSQVIVNNIDKFPKNTGMIVKVRIQTANIFFSILDSVKTKERVNHIRHMSFRFFYLQNIIVYAIKSLLFFFFFMLHSLSKREYLFLLFTTFNKKYKNYVIQKKNTFFTEHRNGILIIL